MMKRQMVSFMIGEIGGNLEADAENGFNKMGPSQLLLSSLETRLLKEERWVMLEL